jgi:diacylglycerol kinase (ATP)
VQTTLVSPPAIPDLVFVNPAAGGGHASDSLPSLRAMAQRTAWQVEFRLTSSAVDLAVQAQAAARAGHSRFFVLGGDGSFQDLVNALAYLPEVVLGILPAGGGNDLADALGLPRHPVRAAEALRDGEVCCMDTIRVKTSDGRTRIYTGGGGVGLDAEASYLAATRFRKLTGRLRYLVSAAMAFATTRPISVRIDWLDPDSITDPLSTKALLVGVLNAPSYGAGLRFAPSAKTNDGLLDLVLVENLSFLEFSRALPRLILRGEVSSPRVKRFLVRHVTIETAVPCRFHGDGEILGYTPVEIEVLPRALRILCPPGSPLRA